MKTKCVLLILVVMVFTGLSLFAQTPYLNFAEALQKSLYFYDAQKCNYTGTNRLEWRGPCHIEDEFWGGYHDAGDHVKFGLPQGYSASTLGWGLYEFKDAFSSSGQNDHMVEILKYFCDYFMRCWNGSRFVYQVGNGDKDHVYWGPPELQTLTTSPRPYYSTSDQAAADCCGEAAAALALMYLNIKESDSTYANTCLTAAKALYTFGVGHRGTGFSGGYYGSAYDDDELSWAAVWLYAATGTQSYIDDITKTDSSGNYTGYMKKIIASPGNSWQNIWVHSWDVVWGGVFVVLSYLFPDNTTFDYFARWNIEYWSGGQVKHQDTADGNYMKYTPAGYGMINTWGSARYNTAAELCALVYANKKNRTDIADWAKGQMTYIMGKNPMNRSYIVGYGDTTGITSAAHPHHAASHGSYTNNQDNPPENRHKLWGGLVGGPDGDDVHKDIVSDYVYNEVAVDYNAALVGALAGFYQFYGKAAGNQPLSNFPPAEAATQEFYMEAKIEQENNARTQVTMKIHMEPVHPPRYITAITCRYYFNISELISASQTIGAMSFANYYDEDKASYGGGATIGSPVAVDSANGIYYVELNWGSSKIFGSREFQLALIAAQAPDFATHWDSTNDYSRSGLSSSYSTTSNIPLYVNGSIVSGQPYGGGTATSVPIATPTATPATTAVPGVTEIPPTPVPASTPSACTLLGDVNSSGAIDIVDALLVAQYYVGLSPANFSAACSDVNCSGSTDIVDALRIAQYYVGLVTSLGC